VQSPHGPPVVPATASPPPTHRPSVLLLALGLGGTCVVSALGAAAIGRAAGWQPDGTLPSDVSAWLGAGSIAIGAAMGLLVLLAPAARTPQGFGLSVLIASAFLMLAGLGFGLGIFLIGNPQPRVFFAALLIAGLMSIVVETAWAVRTIQRMSSTRPGSDPSGDLGVTGA
jgi:hypothetical protein